MSIYLALNEYERIVNEALQELCVASRCKLERAAEASESSGWSITLACDDSDFTICGLEDVYDPQSRKAAKNRIKAAICQRLDLGGRAPMAAPAFSIPVSSELSVLF